MKQQSLRVFHGPRPARAVARAHAGFTLIELMITLVLVAILLTLAIPSFLNFIVSTRLSAAADSMVAAIDAARMAAIKRNASAQFCGDDHGTNPGSNKATADGLDPTGQLATGCTSAGPGAVYIVDKSADPQPLQVQAASSGLASLQLGGNHHVTALRCNSQGVCWQTGSTSGPYSGVVADLCSSQLSSNNHYIIRMSGGTVTRVDRPPTFGACP